MIRKASSLGSIGQEPEKAPSDYLKLLPVSNPEVLLSPEAFRAFSEFFVIASDKFSINRFVVEKKSPEVIKELLGSVISRHVLGGSVRYKIRRHLVPFVFLEGTDFSLEQSRSDEILDDCLRTMKDRRVYDPIRVELVQVSVYELVTLVHKGKLLARREQKGHVTKFYFPEKGD